MGIIILNGNLAISEKDFEYLEIEKDDSLNSEIQYHLMLHYAGNVACLRSSKDYANCRLAFYWYSYLIGSCKGNLVEFTTEDKQWFGNLLSEFESSLNSQVNFYISETYGEHVNSLNEVELERLKDPNRVEIKRIRFVLSEDFRQRIKDYITSKY